MSEYEEHTHVSLIGGLVPLLTGTSMSASMMSCVLLCALMLQECNVSAYIALRSTLQIPAVVPAPRQGQELRLILLVTYGKQPSVYSWGVCDLMWSGKKIRVSFAVHSKHASQLQVIP